MCLCHLYTSHLALTYSVHPIHSSVLPCMCQSLFFYLNSNSMDQCGSFQLYLQIYSIKLHSLCLVIRCFIIVTKLTTWLKHTNRDNAKQNSSRLAVCKFLYILPASHSFSSFSLQNLVKHLPEQEQLNALATYKNEYSNLSEPEQFGVVVSTHNTHKCTIHTNICQLPTNCRYTAQKRPFLYISLFIAGRPQTVCLLSLTMLLNTSVLRIKQFIRAKKCIFGVIKHNI